MYILKKIILAIAILLIGANASGFYFDYRFQHLTIDDGLPQNTVLHIYQDSRGFLWFSTYNGLCRYNGSDVEVFIPEQNNPYTINDGTIYGIVEDNSGKLYFATNKGGLNVYDPITERFTYYLHDTTPGSIVGNALYGLYKANDNTIWMTSYDGASQFFPDSKTFKTYPFGEDRPFGYPEYTSLCVTQDSSGTIWLGTYGGGLLEYIPDKDGFKLHENKMKGDKSYSLNVIKNIIPYKKNELLLSTEGGIYAFNLSDSTFSLFDNFDNQVSSVMVDNANEMWIATMEEGVIHKRKDGSYEYIKHQEGKDYTLPENRINYIYQDKDNNYWVGTGSSGLAWFRGNQNRFYHYYKKSHVNSLVGNNVYAFAEDSNQNVWIGTESGLSIFNNRTRRFKNITKETKNSFLTDNTIWDLFNDGEGNIWIGQATGAVKYNLNTKNIAYYEHSPNDSTTLPSNEVFCFEKDKNGDVWLGTYFGLCRYNKNTDNFTAFYDEKGDSTLSNSVIWYLHSDSKGRLWVGTSAGLNRYDFENNRFVNYDRSHPQLGVLADIEVNYIHEDTEGVLWISTANGLLRYNVSEKTVKRIGLRDGLPNLMLYGILEHGNHLWFTSNNGLSRLDKFTYEIANFDVYDGLQSNEFNIATLELNNGVFMFGGIYGITAFHPESINNTAITPKLYFTQLKLNGAEVKPLQERFGQVPLKKSIMFDSTLHLSHNEKLIQIDFAALEYFFSKKINFSYRVLPNSKEWIHLKNTNSVTFTNLVPGKYTLEVRSTNTEQVWTNNVKTLKIFIHPPFYKQTWFYLFETLLIITLIMIYVRYRTVRVKKANIKLERTVVERTEEINAQKEELQVQRDKISEQKERIEHAAEELEIKVFKRTMQYREAKEKAEESDRLKSAFLANMSHEIRTPMNAIMGFSDLLVENSLSDEERKSYATLIKTNSNNLLDLLNDILDVSLIESGRINISKHRVSVNKILNDVYQSFLKSSLYKEKKGVKLNLTIGSSQSLHADTDPVRLIQVLNNLISNALKYTKKGEVQIYCKPMNDFLLFSVKDTGIGIEPRNMDQIFDRFHKVDDSDTHIYRGGGLGLAISKNLVELLGGEIWVESKVEQGSVFYFTLPIHATDKRGQQ